MSKLFFIFSETGVVVGTIPPPPAPPANYVLLDADTPLHDVDGRMLAPDGSYRWMLMSQPCFGGLDGRTAMLVPDDAALAGKSWADLAAMTSVDHPHGLLQVARPETNTERRAREKAQADADAAAAAAARLAAKVSMAQFRKALKQVGLFDDVDGVMASPETPDAIKIDWEYATEVRRAWPAWTAFLPLINKTEDDLDAVFALSATL